MSRGPRAGTARGVPVPGTYSGSRPAGAGGAEGPRGVHGGLHHPLPPWLSPAAPWPGARPPCAAPPDPPPATRPSPTGGWCTTPPSPGGAGLTCAVPPRKQRTQPQTRPRSHLHTPQHLLSRAGAHHRGLWGQTAPPPKPPPGPARDTPRGDGGSGAAVATAPARNVTPRRRLRPAPRRPVQPGR